MHKESAELKRKEASLEGGKERCRRPSSNRGPLLQQPQQQLRLAEGLSVTCARKARIPAARTEPPNEAATLEGSSASDVVQK